MMATKYLYVILIFKTISSNHLTNWTKIKLIKKVVERK